MSPTTSRGDSLLVKSDMNNNSTIVTFPVKLGETLYKVTDNKIIVCFVEKLIYKNYKCYFKLNCNALYETSCNAIGKTIFRSLEEANRKLNDC